MEPLKQLFDLYEAEMAMQTPFAEPEPAPEPPPVDNTHPITKQNKEVEDALRQGMGGPEAHETVYGQVNIGDPTSKAQLASTLGKAQGQKVHAGALPEPGSQSIFAKEFRDDEEQDATTDQDLKSPVAQQIPDSEQQAVETQEEFDYNDDVAYLRTYGRA
mgnify:CR=1 FL=1